MSETSSQQIQSVSPGLQMRRRRSQLWVTLSHWVFVAAFVLCFLSGMRISWGSLRSPLGGSEGFVGALLHVVAPQGPMVWLHVTGAWIMVLAALVYALYMLGTGESRRIRLRPRRMVRSIARAVIGEIPATGAPLWSVCVIVYWAGFALVGLSFLSGLILYRHDWNLDGGLGGYLNLRFLHSLLAYLFLPYLALHGTICWYQRNFLAIFGASLDPRLIRGGLVALGLAVPMVGFLFHLDSTLPRLRAQRIPPDMAPPRLDGDPSDPAWAATCPVVISTVKGANFPDGRTTVELRALRSETELFLRVRWADPSRSDQRYPLRRRRRGWEMLGSRFHLRDEHEFYEDKLAIYVTDVPGQGCASSCHLGPDPLGTGHPSTWGLHYTNGEVADMWHWKYVRTNQMEGDGAVGYMDDQHVGPPGPVPTSSTRRYTAGYRADPQPGGGYRYNFRQVGEQGQVVPLMLPKPGREDARWLHPEDVEEYRPDADAFAAGATIANILVEPFQGDRADVRAKGAWHEGYWTLEISRRLATGSPFDVDFHPGRPIYLSVAAFDNAQTRHTEHFHPIEMTLDP
jgi:thiosulfate reductase cytochrome b subunit